MSLSFWDAPQKSQLLVSGNLFYKHLGKIIQISRALDGGYVTGEPVNHPGRPGSNFQEEIMGDRLSISAGLVDPSSLSEQKVTSKVFCGVVFLCSKRAHPWWRGGICSASMMRTRTAHVRT